MALPIGLGIPLGGGFETIQPLADECGGGTDTGGAGDGVERYRPAGGQNGGGDFAQQPTQPHSH